MRRWLPPALCALLLLACGSQDEEAAQGAAEASAAASTASDGGSAGDEVFRTPMLGGDPQLPLDEARQKFDAECAGSSTPDCKLLQWRLEYALYEDLRELRRAGALDAELIEAAAMAESPQLQAFALDYMRERGLLPGEGDVVIAALNNPYPLVRESAQNLVGELPDERWSRMLARRADVRKTFAVEGLIAGVQPDATTLGAAAYPGATYWYFASGPAAGDFFTSPDSPDDVIEFYAQGGKPVLDGAALQQMVDSASHVGEQDPTEMMRLMQEALEAGKDPSTVVASLTAGAGATSVAWTEGIDGVEGVREPRYVVLEQSTLLGKPVPRRVVAVFQDDAMGATSMIFRRTPDEGKQPDPSDEAAMERFMRVQEILASPDARAD